MHTPRRRHSHRLICVRAYTVRLSTMCATPSLVSSVHSSFLLPQHPQGFLLRVLHMCIQMASADHHKSSSWLYRGLAPHDADASDASSQDMYVSSTSYALNGEFVWARAQIQTRRLQGQGARSLALDATRACIRVSWALFVPLRNALNSVSAWPAQQHSSTVRARRKLGLAALQTPHHPHHKLWLPSC
jgi:hypothetical protein